MESGETHLWNIRLEDCRQALRVCSTIVPQSLQWICSVAVLSQFTSLYSGAVFVSRMSSDVGVDCTCRKVLQVQVFGRQSCGLKVFGEKLTLMTLLVQQPWIAWWFAVVVHCWCCDVRARVDTDVGGVQK